MPYHSPKQDPEPQSRIGSGAAEPDLSPSPEIVLSSKCVGPSSGTYPMAPALKVPTVMAAVAFFAIAFSAVFTVSLALFGSPLGASLFCVPLAVYLFR